MSDMEAHWARGVLLAPIRIWALTAIAADWKRFRPPAGPFPPRLTLPETIPPLVPVSSV